MAVSGSTTFNEDDEAKNAREGVLAYEVERTSFVQAIINAIPENTQDVALLNLVAQLKQEEKMSAVGLAERYDLAIEAVQKATDLVAAGVLQKTLLNYNKMKAVNSDYNYFVSSLFVAEIERKEYFEQHNNQLVQEIKIQQTAIDNKIEALKNARDEFVAYIDKSPGFVPSEKTNKSVQLKELRLNEIKEAISILIEQKNTLANHAMPPAVQPMILIALDTNSIKPFLLLKINDIQQYSQTIKKSQSIWSRIFGWKTSSDRAKDLLEKQLKAILVELSESPPPVSLNEVKLQEAILCLQDTRPRVESKVAEDALLSIKQKMLDFKNESQQLESPKYSEEMAEIKKISGERESKDILAQIKSEAKSIEDDVTKITAIVVGMNTRLKTQAKAAEGRVKRVEVRAELKKGDLIHGACAQKQRILQPEKRQTDESLKFLNNAICVSNGHDKDKAKNIFHKKTRDSANTAAKFAYHRLKNAWTLSGNPSGDPLISLQIQRRAAAAASFLAYAIAKDRTGPGSDLKEGERNNIKTALFIYGQLISTNYSLAEIKENAKKESYASAQLIDTGNKGSTFQKIIDEFLPPGQELIGQADFVSLSLGQAKEKDSASAKEYQALLDFHNRPEGNLINFAGERKLNQLDSPSNLIAIPFQQKIFSPSIVILNQNALLKIHNDHVQTQQTSVKLVGMIGIVFNKLEENASAVQEIQHVRNNLLNSLKTPTQDNEQYSAQVAVRANLAALLYATSRELNEKLKQNNDPNTNEKIKNQIKYLFQLYDSLVQTGLPIATIISENRVLFSACQIPFGEPLESTYNLLKEMTQSKSKDVQSMLRASDAGSLMNEVNVNAIYRFHTSGAETSFYHKAIEKNLDGLDEKLISSLDAKREDVHLNLILKEQDEKEAQQAKEEKTPKEIQIDVDKTSDAVVDKIKKEFQDSLAESKKMVGELQQNVDMLLKASGIDPAALEQKKEIADNAVLSDYYYTFIKKLTAELLAAKTIYSGKVTDARLTPAQEAAANVKIVGSFFTLFGGDVAANAVAAGVNFHEERKKAIANTYLANSFTTTGEADQFIEELARKLTMQQKYHLEEVKSLNSTDIIGQASGYISKLKGIESLSSIKQYASSQVDSFLTAVTEGHFGEVGLELLDPLEREKALDRAVTLTVGDSVYVQIEKAIHPDDPETSAALEDLRTQLVAAAEATEEERLNLEGILDVEVVKPKEASSKKMFTTTRTVVAAPSNKDVELDKKQAPGPQSKVPVTPAVEEPSPVSQLRRS